MLNFKRVELDDRRRAEEILRAEAGRGCEYTFGNIYIWRDVYNAHIAFTGDGICAVRFGGRVDAYLFPAGAGDIGRAVGGMLEDSAERGRPFRIVSAGRGDVELLERLFPGRFASHVNRDFAEYVYNSGDLINLAGRRYHSKRNHISRFEAEYPDYRFEEITPGNIAEARAMCRAWYREHPSEDGEGLKQEADAVGCAFDSFFELDFKGGLVRADGGVVAFAMGEPINRETFCVHIEKARTGINGAYAIINRDFARCFCEKYRFINREDDVGKEGLRRAKLSYHPAEITEKHVVTEL
jgi:hypothetical protein